MNANHARPMLAFWLLALIAALITALGLRSGPNHVTVPSGTPAPVQRGDAPELLLGGLLRDRPVTPAPARPPVVTAAASSASGSGTRAVAATASTGQGGGPGHSGSSKPAVQPTTTAPTTTSGGTGHGTGRKKGSENARTTTRSGSLGLQTTGGHGKAKGHADR